MTRGNVLITIAIVVFLLVSIWLYKQGKALMNYCYNINFHQSRFGIKGNVLTMKTVLEFGNQSNTDVHVNGYEFNLFINNKHISTIKDKGKQILKARSLSPFVIETNVDFRNLQKISVLQLASLMTPSDKDVIKCEGWVGVGLFGISIKKIPISVTFTTKELLSGSSESTPKCKIA